MFNFKRSSSTAFCILKTSPRKKHNKNYRWTEVQVQIWKCTVTLFWRLIPFFLAFNAMLKLYIHFNITFVRNSYIQIIISLNYKNLFLYGIFVGKEHCMKNTLLGLLLEIPIMTAVFPTWETQEVTEMKTHSMIFFSAKIILNVTIRGNEAVLITVSSSGNMYWICQLSNLSLWRRSGETYCLAEVCSEGFLRQ
jgi:hypothetical protein